MDGTFPRRDVIENAAQAQTLQLVITLTPDGSGCSISGSALGRHLLCFGMLGMATAIVQSQLTVGQQPALEVVRGNLAGA